MTPAFFENLSNGNQQDLIQHLIDALLHTKSVHVGTLIKSKMKMVGSVIETCEKSQPI